MNQYKGESQLLRWGQINSAEMRAPLLPPKISCELSNIHLFRVCWYH